MRDTEKKHTPGPWRNERGSGDYGRNITADNGRRIICETICSDHAANAALIVAAPDLLAACEAALDFIHSLPYTPGSAPETRLQDKLVDAIARAKGGL